MGALAGPRAGMGWVEGRAVAPSVEEEGDGGRSAVGLVREGHLRSPCKVTCPL